jgi:hypothetical protein
MRRPSAGVLLAIMISFRHRVASAVAILIAVAASSSPASACWDGYSAHVGKLSIFQAGDDGWDPARARDIATWSPRIDAILPAGAELTSEHGFVELTRPGHDALDGKWRDGKMESLYLLAAKLAGRSAWRGSPPAAHPYTVQVFAARSITRADAFAASLDETLEQRADTSTDLVGFYEAGGYPARHALTHVVTEKDDAGRPIHRVVVGAFMRAEEASRAFGAVRKETNLAGFVRPL